MGYKFRSPFSSLCDLKSAPKFVCVRARMQLSATYVQVSAEAKRRGQIRWRWNDRWL